MERMELLAGFLALFWGLVWAVMLWGTGWGRFLRQRRTWLTVVMGVGGDLMIAGLVLELRAWLLVWGIVGLSAVGIVGFCLEQEYREHRDEMDAARRGE